MKCFRSNACVVLDCADPCTGKFGMLRVTICNVVIDGKPVRNPSLPKFAMSSVPETGEAVVDDCFGDTTTFGPLADTAF